MVSHVRAVRLFCKLCNAGAFYCADMRRHLEYRHCENLHLAPEGYVAPNGIVPCMSPNTVQVQHKDYEVGITI